MLQKIKVMCKYALKGAYIFDVSKDKKYSNQRLFGELLRNIHSIEKGLSLRNVRSGFGYEKISEAYSYALTLSDANDPKYNEAIEMYISSLESYLSYHESIGFYDDKISDIQRFRESLIKKQSISNDSELDSLGGYQTVISQKYSEDDYKIIESLFNNRHSVREFNGKPVDMNDLFKAINLAHHCPSACNRQGYRVHIVSNNNFSVFDKWFDGVGGFADELDKVILITGDLSTYRMGETMQYIVSSAVFAAYLTLALESLGIGCCFIQRTLVITDEWKRVRSELHIPENEQIVCALGIGNLMEEYKVPVSHRLSLDTIVTVH